MNNTTYSTGTVSVGAASTTLTGIGTAWLTGGVRAGDVIILAGLMVVISSVTSNTEITLKRPWPGAAQSGANYDILMLDDEVRSLTAANTLLASLTGGTLTSLAGLPGAANKMAYFSGVGVMALADLTPEARSLLGSTLLSRSGDNLVTAAAARLTGGVVTSSASDTAAGRVLRVGAGYQQLDANLYRKGNILGTVSQVAGAPTGAVIERGSNANGDYAKFADGTLICTKTNFATAASASALWVYPSPYIGTAAPVVSVIVTSGAPPRYATISSRSPTQTNVHSFDSAGSEAVSPACDLMAIGRWF